MNKYFSKGLLVSLVMVVVFVSSLFINTVPAQAQSMDTCGLINLLIVIGVIPTDKADMARSAFNCSNMTIPPNIPPVLPPSATSTRNFVSIVGSPTLELLYDSAQKESQLMATFKLSIQAGNQDLNVYRNTNPVVFLNQTDKGRQLRSSGIIYPDLKVNPKTDQYGQTYYTIPAGTSLVFFAQSTANPKIMFAGSYYAKFNSIIAFNSDVNNQFSIEAPANTNTKTIIGETSPYIKAVTYKNSISQGFNGVQVDGVRLNGKQTANVNCNNSGKINTKLSGGVDDEILSFVFIDSTKNNESCSIQINDPKTGESNKVGFTVSGGNSLYPSLELLNPKVDGYTVSQNGVTFPVFGQIDTAWCKNSNPNAIGNGPFEFRWGVSGVSCSWFPAVYTFPSVPGNYEIIVRVKNINGNEGYITENSRKVTVPSIPINQPSITVLSPNGGESYKDGDRVTIKWKTAGLSSNQKLDISLDVPHLNSIVGQTIALGVPNTGSYSWIVKSLKPFYESEGNSTVVPDGRYKVTISCPWNDTKCQFTPNADSSDSYFKIVSATSTLPSITVLSPNGGESWPSDKTQVISWSSVGGDYVSAYLTYPDGGTCYLGKNSSDIGRIDFYPKNYECPNILRTVSDGQYMVSLFLHKQGDNSDVGIARDKSDSYFKIVSEPTVPVVSNLSASCSASPSSPNIGERVSWGVRPSGGTGTYSFIWRGSDGLSAENVSQVSKTYSTAGVKSASVQVTSGNNTTVANCSIRVMERVATTTQNTSTNQDTIMDTTSPTVTTCYTPNEKFRLTQTAESYTNMDSVCKANYGSGWTFTTITDADENYIMTANAGGPIFSKSFAIKNTPSNNSPFTGNVCKAETTWPESSKMALWSVSNKCYSDVPRDNKFTGLCRNQLLLSDRPACTDTVSLEDDQNYATVSTSNQGFLSKLFSKLFNRN